MTSAPVLDRYRRRAIRTTARPRRGRTTSCSFRSVTFHDLFIYTAYPVAISVVGEPVFATSVIRLVAIITRKTGRRQTRGGASFAIRTLVFKPGNTGRYIIIAEARTTPVAYAKFRYSFRW